MGSKVITRHGFGHVARRDQFVVFMGLKPPGQVKVRRVRPPLAIGFGAGNDAIAGDVLGPMGAGPGRQRIVTTLIAGRFRPEPDRAIFVASCGTAFL